MPELPEVETIKRDLERTILDQKIVNVTIHDGRVIREISLGNFVRKCQGRTIAAISRRGKAVILTFSPTGYLIVQPMMTGQLIYTQQANSQMDKHGKVAFLLSNGSRLTYNDQRLFGRLSFVEDLGQVKLFQTIGPEPLDKEFNPNFISQAIKNRTAPIKSFLMNQNFVAGIGNIYASEILFESHIHPERPARKLKSVEIKRLHKMTVEVLEKAIHFRGTSMRNYIDTSGKKGNFINRIKVYGRENEACVVCRAPIQKIVQSGRSTFYCKKCQK